MAIATPEVLIDEQLHLNADLLAVVAQFATEVPAVFRQQPHAFATDGQTRRLRFRLPRIERRIADDNSVLGCMTGEVTAESGVRRIV
jgi:hypothetical protein